MNKLSWDYDSSLGCEVAMHNGYRIRAVQDTDAQNPFEEYDGNWPIVVYSGRSDGFTAHDKVPGADVDAPLRRFSDTQLVHNQKALAALFDRTIRDIATEYDDTGDDEEPANYLYDADILRHAFQHELDCGIEDSKRLSIYSELYTILGIPSYVTTSRGHCQGDWAEILVVATPEACEEFGLEKPMLGVGPDAHITTYWDDRLESTADLWGYWAWGDVYGYIIEAPVYDEDGEIVDWVDACQHNSCWGFYGDDHHESGLEEQALDAVPDEPAPEPVRSSDELLEDA